VLGANILKIFKYESTHKYMYAYTYMCIYNNNNKNLTIYNFECICTLIQFNFVGKQWPAWSPPLYNLVSKFICQNYRRRGNTTDFYLN